MLGGAIRGFNLPLVLAGLIVGALLMQWRLSRRMVELIDCRRRLPDEAFVGQTFATRFLVSNRSAWLPALLLRIDDQIRMPDLQSPPPDGRNGEAEGIWEHEANRLSSMFRGDSTLVSASCGIGSVTNRHTVVASYDCISTRRGKYEFGPIVLSTGMPLGLMLVKRTIADRQVLWVYPRILPMRRDWRRRLQSRTGGLATTARRTGASDGDFFGLRTWQAGDSRRWIHWRTTARIGEPAVRQFEQQRRFDLCVLVDAFQLPTSGLSELKQRQADEALEFVISAAASLMTQLAPTPTNRVALAVAGRKNAVIANGGSREQLNLMMRVLAELQPSETPDFQGAVELLFRTAGRPQDLVILSTRPVPAAAERLLLSLGERFSFRWCSVTDGTIDRLVERVESERERLARRAETGSGDSSNVTVSSVQPAAKSVR